MSKMMIKIGILFIVPLFVNCANSGAQEMAIDPSIVSLCDDADGDGFTVAVTDDSGTTLCSTESDCDDTDSTIYPYAAEIADDTLDQDCDGADLAAGTGESVASDDGTSWSGTVDQGLVDGSGATGGGNETNVISGGGNDGQDTTYGESGGSGAVGGENNSNDTPDSENDGSGTTDDGENDDNGTTNGEKIGHGGEGKNDDGTGFFPDSDKILSDDNSDDDNNDADGGGLAALRPTTWPENYTPDAATAVFQGFSLNFGSAFTGEGSVNIEIDDVGAGFWNDDFIDVVDDEGNLTGIEVVANALLTKSDDKDISYDWGNDYAGVLYDSSTMKVYRSALDVECLNGLGLEGENQVSIEYTDGVENNDNDGSSNGACYASEEISVQRNFGSTFSGNADDYVYFVAIDGFKLKTGDNDSDDDSGDHQDPIGGEDMIVSTYIYNNAEYTHDSDKDNGDNTDSNGNDHYAGSDGKLRLFVTTNFNGPESVPDYWGKVWFTVIGFKKDVWGMKWFEWDEATAGAGGTSTTTFEGLDSLESANQAFLMLHSLGFDGAETGSFELSSVYAHAYIDSVSDESATVKIYGNMVNQNLGTHYIRSNATNGYLIYCKESAACQTSFSGHSDTKTAGAGSDGDSGAAFTDTIEIN
jgi:hypothetical protein